MLIQVDVDSTLYDADVLFGEVAPDFGVEWVYGMNHWGSPADFGTDLETLLNLFRQAHSRPYVLKNKPYDDAVSVLNQIAEDYEDAQIAYVSDRNEMQTDALHEWLSQEGFLSSGDEFVAATKDKREWMRANRPDIVVDDRVRTMLMARFELDAYVASLVQPHNINLKNEVEGVWIVPDWKTLGKVLNEEIIPKVYTKVKV
jgi:hypothetical protein